MNYLKNIRSLFRSVLSFVTRPGFAAWFLFVPFVVGGSLFLGCEEKSTLSFSVLTPEEDPFAGVTSITIRAGDIEKTEEVSDPSQISMSLDASYGAQVRLELVGTNAGGDVLCSGKSPYFYAVGTSQQLKLWVSRGGELSLHPEKLETAAGNLAIADYVNEDWDDVDDDLLYSFWFGGCDGTGLPVDLNGYFDPYLQESSVLPDMADSSSWLDPVAPVAPRCGSVAMYIDSGMFLVYGGTDSNGRPGDKMYLAMVRSGEYKYIPLRLQCGDGVDNDGDGFTDVEDESCDDEYGAGEGPGDWSRSGARKVTLGPYPGLYDDGNYQILNNYLITGGINNSSTRSATAFHVTAKISTQTLDYAFDMEAIELLEPRGPSHTITLTTSLENDVEVRTVLIYGGTEDASGVFTAETLRYQIDWSDPGWGWSWVQNGYVVDADENVLPPVTGHAAVTLTDGTILVAGGKTSDGTRLADAWLYYPKMNEIEYLPNFLDEPRAGHTMTRTGNVILVAGGEEGSGELAEEALLLVDDSLNGQLEQTGRTPMNVPRWGHSAMLLGNGELALIGGFDSNSQPLSSIEIFNPRF